MTVKELSKLYHLKRLIAQNEARLARLREDYRRMKERIEDLHASMEGGMLASPSLSGMPRSPVDGSKTENAVFRCLTLEASLRRCSAQIQALERDMLAHQEKALAELRRLEAYIAGIGDPIIQQLFTARFIDGLTWEQVAASTGGRYGTESARVECYRYLKKHA